MDSIKLKRIIENNIPRRIDILITVFILALVFFISLCFVDTGGEDYYASNIFLLAITVISVLTRGYLCGLLSALIGVIAVNYAFTYPFFAIDFRLPGYPLTFAVFLIVSTIIIMFTTRIKEQAKMQAEMEKEKMRGNLLRAVSHDIRTPLTSISGAASAILENKDRLDENGVMSLVNDIKGDADWLICMVENILTVTRIGEQTGRINKNPEAAEEIISEAVIKFKKRYDIPLEAGADDYITKPFGTQELVARVRTAIRHTRTSSSNNGISLSGIFKTGGLTIDYDKYRAYINGNDANLTQNEFKIVALLGKNAGRVLTYDYIIKQLWGPHAKTDNQILRVNMANIRRKIEKKPAEPEYIFTEVGVGYRMSEGDDSK